MPSDISFENPLRKDTTHYLFSEYFQSLRVEKIKTNFISFFLGKLQIDSILHSLRFVTFPVWLA
jgi:hypothetical protein